MSELDSQRRGKLGQSRTEAVVSERFWILHSNIDVDGADLLVREPFDPSTGNIPPLHVVRIQAKYRSWNSPALVPIFYVEQNGKARPDFFLFLHTGESPDPPVMWFFDAEELLVNGQRTDDGKSVRLKIVGPNSYPGQIRGRDFILDRLARGLKETSRLSAMYWLTLWRNPVASEFVRQVAKASFTVDSLAILERLGFADLQLLERLSEFIMFIDGNAFVLPMAERAIHADGTDDYLDFPFSIQKHDLDDAPRFFTKLNEGKLQLPDRTVTNLSIWDNDGVQHLYPMTDGFGLKVRCVLHQDCWAGVVNATLATFWRKELSTWHRGGRISQLDPRWNLGFLTVHFSPGELRRLESLGILESLESVTIDQRLIIEKDIHFGNRGYRLTSSSSASVNRTHYLNELIAIEFTPGGSELMHHFPADRPNQQVSEIIHELFNLWQFGALNHEPFPNDRRGQPN